MISAAPAAVFQPTGSCRNTAPSAVENNGVTYVTVEATVDPAARMTVKLSRYARPVPTAPMTTSAATAPHPGQCGRPLTSGAAIPRWTVPQVTCAVDSTVADSGRPARNLRVYANAAP
ncbi:hypothetical protein GCM10029964_013800 [Kibdelosporangium lantanae]